MDDWDDSPAPASAPSKPAPSGDDWGTDTTSTKANGGDDWGSGTNGTSGGDEWGTTTTSNGGGGGWGSGGDGGGARGKRSGSCYNCNESGHMSRDCPQPKKERTGGGGGVNRACFKCGKEGHMSRECTESGGGGGGGNRGCFKCGKEGHMSRECTEPGDGNRRPRGPMKCYKCQGEGHMSKDCPQNGGGGASGGDSTDWGSGGGGGSTDWGAPSGDSKPAASGGDDWGAGGGDSKPSGGDGDKKGGSGCRRCGKEGHFARECTEEAKNEDGTPKAPLYKPADLDENDESLFQGLTAGINFKRYENLKCNVSGKDPPAPITQFSEAISSEMLTAAIKKSGYTVPTPVQKYGIPIIVGGRDLMACAQTGSGKTAAFLLPICQTLLAKTDLESGYGEATQNPYCVIVTPTRELAIQIYQEAFKFTIGTIVKPQILYGGTSVGHQIGKLSSGCHILVATPGRLLDVVEKGKISFSKLKWFVLDEADRMIDQGFIPDIRRMVSSSTMPAKEERQTLMFSATFPDEVQRLAAEFLRGDYLFLAIGIVGGANQDVEQQFLKVQKFEKRQKVDEILKTLGVDDRIMIFVEQKKTADFLAAYLSQQEWRSTSMHGDRFQSQREDALREFRSGKTPILVATSVAARGLDIKDVRCVINYDLPKEIDEYVHRIGRTGRLGNTGKAISFYDPGQDQHLAASLVKIMNDADQVVPEWLLEESTGGSSAAGEFVGCEFGGRDIRKGNKGDDWGSSAPASSAPAASTAMDEDW